MASRIFTQRFRWLSALPLLVVALLLSVIALGALTGAQSPSNHSREALFDYFQRLTPAAYDASNDFHVIEIDRESVDAVGPWPWPRSVLADLVRAARRAGADGVVIATPVDSPDPLSPETIGEFWLSGAGDAELARELAQLPQTDETLARAMSGVAGAVAVAEKPASDPALETSLRRVDARGLPWFKINDADVGFIAAPAARYFYALNTALGAAARPAVASLTPDPDGVLRRTPMIWSLDGAAAPSLSLEAARIAAGGGAVTGFVRLSSAQSAGRSLLAVSIADSPVPVSEQAALRLKLPRRITVDKTSASRLLDGGSSNSQLRDKVVLIGLAAELGGVVNTARGAVTPAEAHALIAAQALDGAGAERPGWTGYLEALSVMLFGAAAVMIAQRMAFWNAAGLAALGGAVLIALSFAVYSFNDILVSPLPAALAMLVGALPVAGTRSIGGVLRDDSVRGSFKDTLPEAAMAKLRDETAGDVLKGKRREITVLACELRLSDEDLASLADNPDDVTTLLAAASNDLKQTIIETGGVADQAEGGRIFAYYNAPTDMADHVQAGCAAALRLIESMDKINGDLARSSRSHDVQVHLAIGIATGDCHVGPMGHGRSNRYSAIGPAVDRAAFLRSQSEIYGPAMICDESVYREVHHHFAFLEMDKLKSRTDGRSFAIYALIGNPFIKSSKGFRELDETQRKMLSAYRSGDFAAAQSHLRKAKAFPGATIAVFDIFERRIERLLGRPAPDGWDGVHEASI